jgi:hypothetical protein
MVKELYKNCEQKNYTKGLFWAAEPEIGIMSQRRERRLRAEYPEVLARKPIES